MTEFIVSSQWESKFHTSVDGICLKQNTLICLIDICPNVLNCIDMMQHNTTQNEISILHLNFTTLNSWVAYAISQIPPGP